MKLFLPLALSLSFSVCVRLSLFLCRFLFLSLSFSVCLSFLLSLSKPLSLWTPSPTPPQLLVIYWGKRDTLMVSIDRMERGHTCGFNRQVGKGNNVWNLLLIFNHNARKLSALTLTHCFPLSSYFSLSPTHLLCSQRGSQMWGCLHRNP